MIDTVQDPSSPTGITRFEVIDHSRYTEGTLIGRVLVRYGIRVNVLVEDEGRTMKVFLTDAEPKGGE